MKRMSILALAAIIGLSLFAPVAGAKEALDTPKRVTEDPHGRGGRRGGGWDRRGRRRGGSHFSFGFNFGGRPRHYYSPSRQPVMVCDAYGSCWYQYR